VDAAQEQEFDRRLGQLRRLTPPGKALTSTQIATYCTDEDLYVSSVRVSFIQRKAMEKVLAILHERGFDRTDAYLTGKKKPVI